MKQWAKWAQSRLLIPFVVFLISFVPLWWASSKAGVDFFSVHSWSHWDSALYLEIAKKGYELFPCSPPLQGWCGNTGWFPAYPWMIRALTAIGLERVPAAVTLSFLFHFLTLAIVWNCFLEGEWKIRNALVMLLVSFLPGQIYHYAVFPVSAFTFFSLLAIHFVRRGRIVIAGLFGAAASFTYSTGFVLAPVFFLYEWVRKSDYKRKFFRAVTVALLTAGGLLAVLLLHSLTVGAWDAFFKVQAKYGHGLHNPISTFKFTVQPLFSERIGLRAQNGDYVCVEGGSNGPLVANRRELREWEIFELIPVSTREVLLRSESGNYVSVSEQPSHPLFAKSATVNQAEKFAVIAAGGVISLRARNGFFVSAEEGGGGRVVANARFVGLSEIFEKVRAPLGLSPRVIVASQSFFMLGLIAACLAFVTLRRRAVESLNLILVMYAIFFWLVPYVSGTPLIGDIPLSLCRSESTLLPLAIVFRSFSPWFQIPVLVVSLLLDFWMGQLFFKNILV
ncbi:MAG: hypothetical protein HY645_12035 [Acidobacteria bacterium]|nr:hypothetical protein [Acidobacteriota bacterium]